MSCRYTSLWLVASLAAVAPVVAQAPETVSVQGYLTNPSGIPLNGPYDLTFTLYDAPSSGTLLWTQAFADVVITDGIYNMTLGPGGTPPLEEIAFDKPLWLFVLVDGEPIVPPITLSSTPYALGLRGLRVIPSSDSESGLSPPSLVGGYHNNHIHNDAQGATISGGGDGENHNRVGGNYGTVGGGKANQAGWVHDFSSLGSHPYATVGGGKENYAAGESGTVAGGNYNRVISNFGTIGGGSVNRVGEPADGVVAQAYSTIGGGWRNAVLASYGFIGGGGRTNAGRTFGNVIYDPYGVIAGGSDNTVGTDNGLSSDGQYTTVGGGYTNLAEGPYATIGGGRDNKTDAAQATVGGGSSNQATAQQATVSGGDENFASANRSTIGGGSNNRTRGLNATVAGGAGNEADGRFSMVPGGLESRATDSFAFAAGWQAEALHKGAFVWADSTDAAFSSTADNQFLIRAGGGVGIGSESPVAQLHVADNKNRSTVHVQGTYAGGIPGATVHVSNVSKGSGVSGYFEANGTDAAFIVKNNGSGSLLKAYAGTDLRFHVESGGDVYADGTFHPSGADLAESFRAEDAAASLTPGDVLVVADNLDYAVERSEEPYSIRIAGVYATRPGVLLADDSMANDGERIPVGVVGVIPTKVNNEGGKIARGDLLVSSSRDGYAMRADPSKLGFGMVIGKALEEFSGTTGMIKVLVSVR